MTAQQSKVLRLMLVDDHALVRQSLAEVLTNHESVQVVGQAADGLEALELADRVQPDVVLMDVSMPRMGGLEATRKLKERMPQVRVIGLSMHISQDMAQSMLNAGASAFLTKGCSVPDLLAAVLSGDDPQ